MDRCLSCNQTGVVVHIKGEAGMRGFPFCARCLADLDAGSYAALAERTLCSHEDMSYTDRNRWRWNDTYRDIAREQYRVSVTIEGSK